jgi:glucosamine 6-phosphate synthetase-like amidotransferase/phosphosugar isomerase protein
LSRPGNAGSSLREDAFQHSGGQGEGRYVIGLAKEGNKDIEKQASRVIYIPECMDEVARCFPSCLQLLAYDIATLRGCDIDQAEEPGEIGNGGVNLI